MAKLNTSLIMAHIAKTTVFQWTMRNTVETLAGAKQTHTILLIHINLADSKPNIVSIIRRKIKKPNYTKDTCTYTQKKPHHHRTFEISRHIHEAILRLRYISDLSLDTS